MSFTDLIAFAALLVSVISLVKTNKKDNFAKEWEFYKERMRQVEVAEQNNLNKSNNRVPLIPYFHLDFNKEMYIKQIGDEDHFVLPITLINLGVESATNIMIEPMIKDGNLDNYFKTGGLHENIHFIHEYLDKQYAFQGDSVNLSATCKKHRNAYDVFFKIRFNDLVGRTYEQEFRFLYCYPISKEISMNHTSSVPVCIEDIY